jgi:hypothetical protein
MAVHHLRPKDPGYVRFSQAYTTEYKKVLGKGWTEVEHPDPQQRCWCRFDDPAMVVITIPDKAGAPAAWTLVSRMVQTSGASKFTLGPAVALISPPPASPDAPPLALPPPDDPAC